MTDNKDYTRRNRFNGQSVELTKEESEIHDQVFVHESLELWDLLNKSKDMFIRLNPIQNIFRTEIIKSKSIY